MVAVPGGLPRCACWSYLLVCWGGEVGEDEWRFDTANRLKLHPLDVVLELQLHGNILQVFAALNGPVGGGVGQAWRSVVLGELCVGLIAEVEMEPEGV